MKTGHRYLDYKSKIDRQFHIIKYMIKSAIVEILLLTLMWVHLDTEKFDVNLFFNPFIIFFLLVSIFFLLYSWVKISNLRQQRNVALGILLAKEFEKEEEDIENRIK